MRDEPNVGLRRLSTRAKMPERVLVDLNSRTVVMEVEIR